MQTYGIGGTEVEGDASEAIGEIAQNKTLMVEKLTAEAPFKPEIVEGLTSIDDVFNHFQPSVEVDLKMPMVIPKRSNSLFADWPILASMVSLPRVNFYRT